MPAAPAIYAFKHQSAWETVVMHQLLTTGDRAQARAYADTTVRLVPAPCRHDRDRPRGRRAGFALLIDGARAALARGSPIVIFPEGTRAPGRQAQPYHPGVAALYLQLDTPVVPVALNSGLFWRRRGFIKRPGRIVVEFLEPIEPGLERKAFMAELEQRLEGAADRLIEEAGPASLAA